MSEADVFVIGGGPAGLAAAIASARRGMKVVVADGGRPPIDKPCGEGLMPDSRSLVSGLGVNLSDAGGHEFRGIAFHGAGRSVHGDFPEGKGLGVRRTALHGVLIEAAERAGVRLLWESPVSAIDRIRSRWIIGADGSASRVRKLAGLESFVQNTRRFAYRQHFQVAPWSEFMEVHWAEGCQVYITPVAANEVCVALISRTPDLRLSEALDRCFPQLRERLPRSLASDRERGATTATARLKSVVRGNVALIGDASGSVDAITGEGMCLGFRQAVVLAEALEAGDLARYNRIHPRLSLRPRVMANTMLLMDKAAAIRAFAMNAMSFQPWIFRKLLEVHVA